MKIYVDELPVSCFQCPLVIQYDADHAECVLFKNEWKPLTHEYNDDKTLKSYRLADCPLKVLSKEDTMSDDPIIEELGITDEYNDAEILSEEEFENIFKELQGYHDDESIFNHCDTNCNSCPFIKRCEDRKKRGIMTPAEIAKLFAQY